MKLTDEELAAFRDRALTASTYGHAIGVGEIYRKALAEELEVELEGDTSAAALLELANQALEQRKSPKPSAKKEGPKAPKGEAKLVEQKTKESLPPSVENKTEEPPPLGDGLGLLSVPPTEPVKNEGPSTPESPILPPPPEGEGPEEGQDLTEGEDESEGEEEVSGEVPADQNPADKIVSTGKKKNKKR